MHDCFFERTTSRPVSRATCLDRCDGQACPAGSRPSAAPPPAQKTVSTSTAPACSAPPMVARGEPTASAPPTAAHAKPSCARGRSPLRA
eukprot:3848819-Prymnesium_polylepis.1